MNEIIRAGFDATGVPMPAVSTVGGTFTLDPQLRLQSTNGGPLFTGTAALTRRRVVSLRTTGGQLGGTVDTEVVSPAGDLVVAFVGVPIASTPSPFGPVYVDLRTGDRAGVSRDTTAGANGSRSPSTCQMFPTCAGPRSGCQAANFYQTSGTIEMSNVAVPVLR